MVSGCDETISLRREVGLKRIPATNGPGQTRGFDMVAFILNAIYRQFLRSALPGIGLQPDDGYLLPAPDSHFLPPRISV